jgi:hypothetical protein
MFILSEHRDADILRAFSRYERHLKANRERFPQSAYALATSKWYFDSSNHQCPHDAWLQSVLIREPASGKRRENRHTAIITRLLGAYHDGFIEFHYPQVYSYQLTGSFVDGGHRDWRYDELRVDRKGRLVHEIEWRGTATWLIIASDVRYRWIASKAQQRHAPDRR